jgi:uncharacterized protein (TIGR01777 family)
MVNLRMGRVLLTGASGMIGSALLPTLKAGGARIARLARPGSPRGEADEESIFWDPAKPISPDTVSGFDAVIHLAGENIAARWTAEKKDRLRASRIVTTSHLAQALAQARSKPAVFLSASAIGYYGDRGNETVNEGSAVGTGFAADLARDWEAGTAAAIEAGIRTVKMRIGIVMSAKGGALAKMLPAFRLGAGGRIGSGQQYMSWIDLQDVVGAIHHLLRTDLLSGPVNLAAPKPVTNAEFTKTLASVLSRPAIFPVPAFAVRLAFGEMGDELLLRGQRVEPARLISSGYSFRFSELRASLENVLKK